MDENSYLNPEKQPPASWYSNEDEDHHYPSDPPPWRVVEEETPPPRKELLRPPRHSKPIGKLKAVAMIVVGVPVAIALKAPETTQELIARMLALADASAQPAPSSSVRTIPDDPGTQGLQQPEAPRAPLPVLPRTNGAPKATDTRQRAPARKAGGERADEVLL